MLVEFQVTNFRSFRDTQRLSMVASSDTSLPENTIAVEALGKQRLLRSAVIYGANAAGKSNLIAALEFAKDFVTGFESHRPGSTIPVQPFRLDREKSQSPTKFEFTFIQGEIRYQYGFSVDRHRVYEEWLIAYPKGLPQRWFTRVLNDGGGYSWYFGSKLRGQKHGLESLTRSDALFLAVGAKFSHQQLAVVYEWFDLGLDLIMSSQVDFRLYEELSALLASEYDFLRPQLQNLMRQADLGIVDFDLQERVRIPIYRVSQELPSEVSNDRFWNIRMEHRDGADGSRDVMFSLEEESLGTRRLFGLAGLLLFFLRSGGVLGIDEMDASLHPNLVRHLVQLFYTPHANMGNAQLLFNTHDTTLLDSGLFRRDQIWFVEKDNTGASHLYPLLDYSPRKDEALARGYLRGRYGAIPFLSDSLHGLIPDAHK